MLKRLLTFLSSNPKSDKFEPNVVPRDQHAISRRHISVSALKVMKRLNEAGFSSYLVGGGVRDLLLGGTPKDFDIATDATPEQVRKLFSNSRIIGRRFKIVHVRFGREIIEVTTFRGENEVSNQQVASNTGQLLRDNVYGDMESDAIRRDFTVNALYYSLHDFCVYDFTDGLVDIQQRKLRIIGEPSTRYKEDPVRLLRAVRLAAKLGFTIEVKTAAPIQSLSQLLTNIPPARLFDEILKLFLSGYATATYKLLNDYGLLTPLFPQSNALINQETYYSSFIDEVMLSTDKRIRSNKRVTPAFIFAALLWPAYQQQQKVLEGKHATPLESLHQAAQQTIEEQLTRIMIPKRFVTPIKQIWELQWRLQNGQNKKAYRTLEHPKFRAGYDFLLLREAAGESLNGLGQWWGLFQDADETQQSDMIQSLGPEQKPRKRRRRRTPQTKT